MQPLIGLMRDIGSGHGGKTPAQVAINWTICKGVLPIPGECAFWPILVAFLRGLRRRTHEPLGFQKSENLRCGGIWGSTALVLG